MKMYSGLKIKFANFGYSLMSMFPEKPRYINAEEVA